MFFPIEHGGIGAWLVPGAELCAYSIVIDITKISKLYSQKILFDMLGERPLMLQPQDNRAHNLAGWEATRRQYRL